MADINIDGIVTWLKGWFYDKTEMASLLNAKANLNQNQANYNVVTDGSGNITVEPKLSSLNDTAIVNTGTLDWSNGTNQNEVNDDLDDGLSTLLSRIEGLESVKAIEVVTTKPTASASTMGKLYIVSENSKVNVYYTERSGTSPNYTYSWHKMDTDILDELSIAWSDIQNKPSTFAPSSHTHEDTDIMTEYTDSHGYAQYTTLNYRLIDIEAWIGSINVDSTMATIFTHIDTNWDYYN